jgi:uncharacterized protein YbjT (DUF2867 family)
MATLVFGATGVHGGAVAGALLDASEAVTAFVRDPHSEHALTLERRGARLAVGDLDDAASVTRALADVETAYAVTTPFAGGAEEEFRQGAQIIASAAQARLPWLILASVASAAVADVPHFRSKARIEQALGQSALAWTVVAPSYFYENVLGSRDAIRAGRLPLALPTDTPLQQVALEDLGALVVAILARRDEHVGARVEVAGDDPTPAAMARAIGVRHEQVPLAKVAQHSADLAAMYSFLARDGYAVDIEALKRRYPEVAWRSFAEWAGGIDWQGGDAASSQ